MFRHGRLSISHLGKAVRTQIWQNQPVACRERGAQRRPELMMCRKGMEQDDRKAAAHCPVVELDVITANVHRVSGDPASYGELRLR